VANKLVEKYAKDQNQLFIEQSFSAIASGPLTLARLHAGEMAQAQLENWFSNISASGFEMTSVSITGGQNNEYLFARVQSQRFVPEDCRLSKEKSYRFQDSLNPMLVALEINNCAIPENLVLFKTEVQQILGLSALLLIIGFGSLLIPIIHSIRLGRRLVVESDLAMQTLSQIAFLPVRDLVERALQASNEKTSLALVKSSRQVLHDIKAPIGAILAVVQHISSKSENAQAANLLRSATDRLESISNYLSSSFANIKPVELNELYRLTFSIAHEQELRTGFKSTVISPPQQLLKVKTKCDQVLFGRIISNLLTNAIEALPKTNGSITINFEVIANLITICIEDNGHGMSSETLKMVRSGSLTTKDSGSGSGISSSIGLMNLWGATIDISSQPNNGTKILLKFPVFE
jgi:signal transduction histidine kinase